MKQRQNQRRRQQREGWELDNLKCNDKRFDFDHCSDIKNHISPLVKVIER